MLFDVCCGVCVFEIGDVDGVIVMWDMMMCCVVG